MELNNINNLQTKSSGTSQKKRSGAMAILVPFAPLFLLPLLVSCQSSLNHAQENLYLVSEHSEIYSKNKQLKPLSQGNNERAKAQGGLQGKVKDGKATNKLNSEISGAYIQEKKASSEDRLSASASDQAEAKLDDEGDQFLVSENDTLVLNSDLDEEDYLAKTNTLNSSETMDNTLICDDNVYYESWKAQFDAQWLAHNGHEYTNAVEKNKALSQARTNEYIKIVYPSIEKTGFDFPVVMNQQVLQWINYFTNTGRRHFVVWLKRGRAFMPEMDRILEDYGLPKDLKFLSMIESGYNPKALSYVGAVGLWQFMPATARENGLIINDYVDERRNLKKSTKAAANYLTRLYAKFGSWHLSAASYNGGPGLVRRTLNNYGSDSTFFELTSMGVVNKETAEYVPKLIAAMIIAKNQDKFGFDTTDAPLPPATKTIEVKRSFSLADLASSLRIDKTILEAMNPELRLGITPPAHITPEGKFDLEVPASQYENALLAVNQLPEASNKYIIAARITRRETMASFAARYKISQEALLHANNKLKAKSQLRKGQVVYIPISLGTGQYDKLTSYKFNSKKLTAKKLHLQYISTKKQGEVLPVASQNTKAVVNKNNNNAKQVAPLAKNTKTKKAVIQTKNSKAKKIVIQSKNTKAKKVATSGNRKTSR